MIKKAIIKSVFIFIILSLTNCSSQEKEKLGQQNAVWTESIYLRGYQPTTGEVLTEAHLKRYAETLKKNKVKYAYLFAGPYNKDGHLPDYTFSETAINSVRLLKKYYPEIVILPWVGGIQNKTVYLGDSLWVKNALADTEKMLITLNVPGVHIDFEYILAGDPYLDKTIEKEKPGDEESYGNNVNEFHKKLRKKIPEAFISSVVTATSPDTRPWKRKTTIDELNVLTQHIDQLSFLYYDTYLSDQKSFEDNCLSLIKDIQLLKKTSNKVQCLVAIGTFINTPELQKYRDLKIENIPNSLNTIKDAMLKADTSGTVLDGIALFCDWETDQGEWDEFYQHWARF